MKKNVVLLQPKVGDMDMFRDNPTPPMSLLAASSLVSKSFEVRLVDQRTDRNWESKLSSALDKNTVCAGLTTMTGKMILNALEMAKKAKEMKSGLPLVWGGVHPSLVPEKTAESEIADYAVAGEGEKTFFELAKTLASGGDPCKIPGIWKKRENGPVCGSHGGLLDMNALPPVPYHLADMEKYVQRYRGERMFFYQSSRGCPRRCAYCYNRAFNRGRIRALAVERVLSEIVDLRDKYGFSLVYFLDDNFFIDNGRALAIIRGLKKMGLGCVLQGVDFDSLERLSDRDIAFLEEAGVERIAVGVESGTDRIRNEVLRKNGSVESVRKQIMRLRNRKFMVLCSLIIGLPGESAGEMKRTVDFGMEILGAGNNFRLPQFYIFSPYPGTDLFSAARNAGFEFPRTLEEWGTYEWDYSNIRGAGERDRLERIAFVSKFLDRKMDDYGVGSGFLKAMYNVYRPLAWARLKRGFLKPLPEKYFYDRLKNLSG